MVRLLSCVLLVALWAPAACLGQTGKIVWLNVESAILSTDEGKKEFAVIQKFVDDKTAEMASMRSEFDSLKNQLSVQGSKLTDEARADLQYQISVKETDLQRFQQDTQREIDNRRDRATSGILKKLETVIDKVAREKGLDAVLVPPGDASALTDALRRVISDRRLADRLVSLESAT